MSDEQIETLLIAIQDVVDAPGSWGAKRMQILDYASEDQEVALGKFLIAWRIEESNS